MPLPKRIILTGFMGTGKTVIGRTLARALGFDFVDTDALIEKERGKTIAEIFAQDGEPAFRVFEKKALQEALERFRVVISAGGGAVLDPENRVSMKKRAFVVGLKASPEVILERIQGMADRPLLQGKDRLKKIQKLLSERSPYYSEADLILETDRRKVEEIVAEIQKKLDEKN